MHDRSGGGSGKGGGTSGGGVAGGGNSGDPGGGNPSTPITSIFDSGKPSSAQSIPLPLIVLGGLALLLLLSAAGTWLVRRSQARKTGGPPKPAIEKHG
jgi:hypothetical protein